MWMHASDGSRHHSLLAANISIAFALVAAENGRQKFMHAMAGDQLSWGCKFDPTVRPAHLVSSG